MATPQLTLEHVYALPDLSVRQYLTTKDGKAREAPVALGSPQFVIDRISATIYLANDGFLTSEDYAIVRKSMFSNTYQLPDTELVSRVQAMGIEVSSLMTKHDLIRQLLSGTT